MIKVTNKLLHSSNLSVIVDRNGTRNQVLENILSETLILKFLTEDKLCPNLWQIFSQFQRYTYKFIYISIQIYVHSHCDKSTNQTTYYNNNKTVTIIIFLSWKIELCNVRFCRAYKMIQANKLEINQWLKCVNYYSNK